MLYFPYSFNVHFTFILFINKKMRREYQKNQNSKGNASCTTSIKARKHSKKNVMLSTMYGDTNKNS